MNKISGSLVVLVVVLVAAALFGPWRKEIISLSALKDVPAYARPIHDYQERPAFVAEAGSSVAVSGCDIDKSDIRVVISVSGRFYYVTTGEYELVRRPAAFIEGFTNPMATSSCQGMLLGVSRHGA